MYRWSHRARHWRQLMHPSQCFQPIMAAEWPHAVPSQEHCHPSVLWLCWLGDKKGFCFWPINFLVHDSMMSAIYAIAHPSVHPSVRPSVCPSHGWISRKQLKLGSCNFHCTVHHSSSFYSISFIQKFWRDPSERGRQIREGKAACVISNTSRYI